jgi:hypothetical protein
MERLRGFALGVAFLLAGLAVAVRGDAWGFALVLAGIACVVWVSRWPTRNGRT